MLVGGELVVLRVAVGGGQWRYYVLYWMLVGGGTGGVTCCSWWRTMVLSRAYIGCNDLLLHLRKIMNTIM